MSTSWIILMSSVTTGVLVIIRFVRHKDVGITNIAAAILGGCIVLSLLCTEIARYLISGIIWYLCFLGSLPFVQGLGDKLTKSMLDGSDKPTRFPNPAIGWFVTYLGIYIPWHGPADPKRAETCSWINGVKTRHYKLEYDNGTESPILKKTFNVTITVKARPLIQSVNDFMRKSRNLFRILDAMCHENGIWSYNSTAGTIRQDLADVATPKNSGLDYSITVYES